MKTLLRSTNFKRHLKTSFTNENMWFYFGCNAETRLGAKLPESSRNDITSVSQMNHRKDVNANKRMGKAIDTGFIVDWQINLSAI